MLNFKLKMSDVFNFEDWGYDSLEMARAVTDGFVKGGQSAACTHFEMRVKFIYDEDYISHDADNFVNELSNLPNINEVDDIQLFASK